MEIKNYVTDILLKSKKGKETDSKTICDMVNNKFVLQGSKRLSPQKLRLIINEFRRQEIPVIANSRGYYISYDEQDITNSIVSLTSRISSINNAITGLKNCLTNVVNNK